MTEAELEAKIRAGILTEDLKTLYETFVRFKEEGGEQIIAENLCNKLIVEYSNTNEKVADLIRDVCDFVVGWCLPDVAIWKNTHE